MDLKNYLLLFGTLSKIVSIDAHGHGSHEYYSDEGYSNEDEYNRKNYVAVKGDDGRWYIVTGVRNRGYFSKMTTLPYFYASRTWANRYNTRVRTDLYNTRVKTNRYNTNVRTNRYNTRVRADLYNTRVWTNRCNTNARTNRYTTRVRTNRYNTYSYNTRTRTYRYDTRIRTNRYNTRIRTNRRNTRVGINRYNTIFKRNLYNKRLRTNRYNTNVRKNRYNTGFRTNRYNTRIRNNRYNTMIRTNRYNRLTRTNQYNRMTRTNRYNRWTKSYRNNRRTRINYKMGGVFLTRNGFWYKGSYYRRNCSRQRLYYSLRSCSNVHSEIEMCIKWLSDRQLIGRRQVYMLNGHGFGVIFVKHRRIAFGKLFYKMYRSESRLHNYMKNCVSSGYLVMTCLNKLQRLRWIGLAHSVQHERIKKKVKETPNDSERSYPDSSTPNKVKFINGRFVYKGKQYRLRATQKNFLRLWFRCIHRYHLDNVCFKRLKLLKIYSPYNKGHIGEIHVGNSHMARHLVYTKNIFTRKLSHGHVTVHHSEFSTGSNHKNVKQHTIVNEKEQKGHRDSLSPINVEFINGRFIYKGKQYRLRGTQKDFLKLWFRCIRRYYYKNVCFKRLKFLKIYSRYTGHRGEFHIGNSPNARHLIYTKTLFPYKLSDGHIFVHHPGFAAGKYHRKKKKNTKFEHKKMEKDHGDSALPITVTFKNGRFVYKGKQYLLRTTQKDFLHVWFRCIRRYYYKPVCFRRFKILKIYSPYKEHEDSNSYTGISSTAKHLDYNKNLFAHELSHGYVVVHHPGFGTEKYPGKKVQYRNQQKKKGHINSKSTIKVKFIDGRFVYDGKQYRLRATQNQFLRLWFRCIRRYYFENTCFRRLKILKIYSPYSKEHKDKFHDGNSHTARHVAYTKNLFSNKSLLHGNVVVHHPGLATGKKHGKTVGHSVAVNEHIYHDGKSKKSGNSFMSIILNYVNTHHYKEYIPHKPLIKHADNVNEVNNKDRQQGTRRHLIKFGHRYRSFKKKTNLRLHQKQHLIRNIDKEYTIERENSGDSTESEMQSENAGNSNPVEYNVGSVY